MSEKTHPKTIQFVSWKKHKVDQALTQVEPVVNDFVDDLLFETVLDFCRQKYGFPQALPIHEILQNEPVVPKSPFMIEQVQFENPETRRTQKCPICHETCDGSRYTFHLSNKNHYKDGNSLDIVAKTLEDVVAPH